MRRQNRATLLCGILAQDDSFGGFIVRQRLLHQLHPLHDAEAVLLVDDNESEIAEFDLFLDQRVGADDELGVALGDVAADVAFLLLVK